MKENYDYGHTADAFDYCTQFMRHRYQATSSANEGYGGNNFRHKIVFKTNWDAFNKSIEDLNANIQDLINEQKEQLRFHKVKYKGLNLIAEDAEFEDSQ